MKNFYNAISPNKVWIIALVVIMAACSQFEAIDPDRATLEQSSVDLAQEFGLDELNSGLWNARTAGPVSLSGFPKGNGILCSDAASYFEVDGGFEFTSPNPEPINDETPPFIYTGGNLYLGDNTFQEDFPDGFTITVTNNTFVEWNFEPIYIDGIKYCLKNLVVIVSGGVDKNGYFYNEGQTGDSGLFPPSTPQDGLTRFQDLKLCYNLEPCHDKEPCFEWKGESAWSAGTRYVRKGNWATYSTKAALEAGVTLLAGQSLPAGIVKLENDIITITLKEGWRFKDTQENIKIHHYSFTPPARNPAPGQFTTKRTATSSPFTISVPDGAFYGVHVDVEWSKEVECPVED